MDCEGLDAIAFSFARRLHKWNVSRGMSTLRNEVFAPIGYYRGRVSMPPDHALLFFFFLFVVFFLLLLLLRK